MKLILILLASKQLPHLELPNVLIEKPIRSQHVIVRCDLCMSGDNIGQFLLENEDRKKITVNGKCYSDKVSNFFSRFKEIDTNYS